MTTPFIDLQVLSGSRWNHLAAAKTGNTVSVTPLADRTSRQLTTIPGFTVTAVDTDTSITTFAWSDLVGGVHTLPPGLSINPTTGAVSGTTSNVAQTYAVRLTATDSTGAFGVVTLSWTVF